MFKAQPTVITPVVGYNFKTTLTVHNFHSQGSIPRRAAYRGVTGKYIHTISFTSYQVPIYTPGWRAAMLIKCLAEGQKCQALPRIPRNHHEEITSHFFAQIILLSKQKRVNMFTL